MIRAEVSGLLTLARVETNVPTIAGAHGVLWLTLRVMMTSPTAAGGPVVDVVEAAVVVAGVVDVVAVDTVLGAAVVELDTVVEGTAVVVVATAAPIGWPAVTLTRSRMRTVVLPSVPDTVRVVALTEAVASAVATRSVSSPMSGFSSKTIFRPLRVDDVNLIGPVNDPTRVTRTATDDDEPRATVSDVGSTDSRKRGFATAVAGVTVDPNPRVTAMRPTSIAVLEMGERDMRGSYQSTTLGT